MLGALLTGDDATGALLRAVAGLDVARGVLSVSASAVDHTLCALVRITDTRDGVAGLAAERLVADGLATPLPPDAQDEGVVATLPLGGGARSLTHVVAQVKR